jgi:hypothetical protein
MFTFRANHKEFKASLQAKVSTLIVFKFEVGDPTKDS